MTHSTTALQFTIYTTLNNIRFLLENADKMQGLVNVSDLPSQTFRMAMAVVTVGPIILAYPFFQRYFIKGLTIGSVKGCNLLTAGVTAGNLILCRSI